MPEENNLIEERKEKIASFFKNKKIILALVALAFLLYFAWHIRTANVPSLKDITTNNYTLGPDLDPYVFLRYAKHIVQYGTLPLNDTMRYVPLGFHPGFETELL